MISNNLLTDYRVLLHKLKETIIFLFLMITITGICYIVLYPVILDLSFVIKSEKDFYDPSIVFIPKNFTLDTIRTVWNLTEYHKSFVNSLRVSMMSSILQVISCALTGYGFARFKFPGHKLMFGLVIFTLMVPQQLILAPLYIQFNNYSVLFFIEGGVNLINTHWPIILLSITGIMYRNALYIFMLRQFFRGVPKELDESAMMDGAGRFRIFYRIALPLAKPILITVFLFSFVWQWTDIFYTSTFMFKTRFIANSSASVFARMQEELGAIINFDAVLQNMYIKTSAVMAMIPLIILYIFSQRYFTESIERSGIVG